MNKTTILRFLTSDDERIISKLNENKYDYWLSIVCHKIITDLTKQKGSCVEPTRDFIMLSNFTNLEDLYNAVVITSDNRFLTFNNLLNDNTSLIPHIYMIYNISLTDQKQVEEHFKSIIKSSETCLINGQKSTCIYLDGALLILAKDKTKLVNDETVTESVYKYIKYYFNKTKNKNIKMLRDILEKNKESNTYDIACFDELLENALNNTGDEFDNTLNDFFDNKASELFNHELTKYNNLKILQQMVLSSQKLLKSKIDTSKNLLFTLRNIDDNKQHESFKEALGRYPNITIMDSSADKMIISIDTLLKTWSKADLKILLNNKRSFVWDKFYDMPKAMALFIDIMFNKKYIPRVTQDIRLAINDNNLEINNSKVINIGAYNRICNPHINYHNCFNQAKTAAISSFNMRDYDGAISQIISAVQSITVTDNVVFNEFINMLFFSSDDYYPEFSNSKFLIDRDGNEHSVKELLETVYKDITEMPDVENLTENDVAKETL